MLRWYPSVLLRVVLELTYVPIAFLSIFAVMALVDRETPWNIGPWSGPGASADFWKVAALLAIGWSLLALGWRGAGPVFRWGICVWHLGLTAASLAVALGDSVLQGEAVGFQVSLGLLAPAFSLTALVCALVWVAQDVRRGTRTRSVSPLRRRNRIAAGCAALGLVLAGGAFALDLHEVGVVACLGAMLALHEVLRPLNPSAELLRALLLEGSAPE